MSDDTTINALESTMSEPAPDSDPFGGLVRLARRALGVEAAAVCLDGTQTVGDTPVIVTDMSADDGAWARFSDHAVGRDLEKLVGFAAMPLRSAENWSLGCLAIGSSKPLGFGSEERAMLTDLASLAELRLRANSAAAVQAELLDVAHAEHRRAMQDAMTGVLNRAGITAALEAAMETVAGGEGLSVVVTDVDRFKSINDTLGHAAGDQVIRATASRLCGAVRDEDEVGRLGGDEFLIVLPGCGTRAEAQRVVARMHEAIRSTPIRMRGESDENGGPLETSVTMSLGVAVIPGGATCDADAAVELADQAMYTTKRNGRDGFTIIEAIGLNAA